MRETDGVAGRTDADGRCVAESEVDTRGEDEPVFVPVIDGDTGAVRESEGEDVELLDTRGEGVCVHERIIVRDSRGELDTVTDESCDFVSEANNDREGLTLPVAVRESAREAVRDPPVLRDSNELAEPLLDVIGELESDELPRGERDSVDDRDADLDAWGERVMLGLTLLDGVSDGVCDGD